MGLRRCGGGLQICGGAPARRSPGMTRRAAGLAKAFQGRWRITEMDLWDNDYLDLLEPAHITFTGGHDGGFVFGAVQGGLDARCGSHDGSACAEFSWEGVNDADPACGRGWV